MRRRLALLLLMMVAGCADAPEGGTTSPTETTMTPAPEVGPTATSTTTPAPPTRAPTPPRPELPTGIVFRDPQTSQLRALAGDAPRIELPPGGFDIRAGVLAHGTGESAIVRYEGASIPLVVRTELNHVGRVSLSPDASEALVQATTAPRGGPPSQFDVYRVNLSTREATRLGSAPYNDESPEWSPDGSLVAWSSFSPSEGIDLHLARPDGSDHRVIDDAGAIHLAFSPDGSRILDPGRLRIVEVATGELVADLRAPAIQALRAAGYDLDTRFPGQADRGTFPLDGAFSPDGSSLVFDGAIVKGGAYGVLLMTMDVDGTDFRVVAGPFEVDPSRTNMLNYSELNPMWR